jgi:hypothetical protein
LLKFFRKGKVKSQTKQISFWVKSQTKQRLGFSLNLFTPLLVQAMGIFPKNIFAMFLPFKNIFITCCRFWPTSLVAEVMKQK